jgi:hypothetical protein
MILAISIFEVGVGVVVIVVVADDEDVLLDRPNEGDGIVVIIVLLLSSIVYSEGCCIKKDGTFIHLPKRMRRTNIRIR